MKKLYTLLSAVAILFAVSACNKKGCSDPTADNYVKNVKKARDNKCQYNGEGICGVGIKFCFEINGVKRTYGSANFFDGAPGTNVKRIIWTNGSLQSSPNYEDIIIEIFGNKEGSSYSLSNTGNDKTFKAEFYSGQTGLALAATSGSLTIKKDNSTDGLIATFRFETQNGIEIKDGNVYKLK